MIQQREKMTERGGRGAGKGKQEDYSVKAGHVVRIRAGSDYQKSNNLFLASLLPLLGW